VCIHTIQTMRAMKMMVETLMTISFDVIERHSQR